MKQLTCEMCGSTDLLKQDGVFVCLSCRTKYSVEEAKKMMVEGTVEIQGTVKVDSSDELKNLYQVARRAKDDNNAENAARYYDMILVKDPTSWEASFYVVYFKAMECKIAQIQSAGITVSNCIESVLKLIRDYVMNPEEQKEAYTEVANRVIAIAKMLFEASKNHYDDIDAQIRGNYTQKWLNNAFSALNCTYILGDNLDAFFGSDEVANKLSVKAWEQGVMWHSSLLTKLADQEGNQRQINSYTSKIQKFVGTPEEVAKELLDSGYQNRRVESIKILMARTGLSLREAKDVVDKVFGGSPNPAPTTTQTTNQASGGCYVATAVYGSYDCPQVWTLRRFRDYTLAETWYGRAFIRTYYAISPTLVKWFGHTDWFKNMWKGKLDRMVAKLQANGVESTPYQDKNW